MFEHDTFDTSKTKDAVVSALSVSQAMAVAKMALGAISITVKGEVSELSDKPGYKAVYFTIRDDSSAMPCLMWKNAYEGCEVNLRLGMLVEVSGTFDVYAAKGRMNFTARTLRLAGTGDLRQKVAELARKLEREGLMSPSRKRALPSCPQAIAIVTSPRGKAVHDCIRTLKRRWPLSELYVCGVAVEGANAVKEMTAALSVAEDSGAEVILLVRGGGSYEDLMPFNDEMLARKVASCTVPVVTGIGHEPDNSICDMVSDLRCSTPTAAAEAVTPDRNDVLVNIDGTAGRLARALDQRLKVCEGGWNRLSSQPLFRNPTVLLSERLLALDTCASRLQRAIPDALSSDRGRLDAACSRLIAYGERPLSRFDDVIAMKASRLEDLSPLSILSRGYAIAYAQDGHTVIDSIEDAAAGDDIEVKVKDGRIRATIQDTYTEE